MTAYLVIDLETSGLAPPAEVIELGMTGVIVDGGRAQILSPTYRLFAATAPLSAEVRAVHHICDRDLHDLPVCTPSLLSEAMAGYLGVDLAPDAYVAHSAAMEEQWVTPQVRGGKPLICTLKAASRIWPDAPRFSNGVLRYWLEDQGLIQPHPRLCQPAHRAGPDSYVTAHIFSALLQRASVEQMIAWTAEPRLLPNINFGKHKGSKWPDAPADYLVWVVNKSDLDADTKWNAQRELDRRRAA